MMRIGLLVACLVLSAARIPDWQSDLSLWSAAVSVTPLRPRPSLNVATARLRAGDISGMGWWVMRGLALAEAPERAYERDVVRRVAASHLQIAGLCADSVYASAC
jgi:hypothetical protein